MARHLPPSANRLLGDRLNDGIPVWAYDVTSTLQMDNNIVSGRVTAPDAYSAIWQSAGGNLTALNNTVVHGNYGLALTDWSVSQPAKCPWPTIWSPSIRPAACISRTALQAPQCAQQPGVWQWLE
ncbi:MAG: hypothetical protein IPO08_17100 [Xanthomonadales bacterium]|nr:hypothetical protein [Xanthomonadales bacterium]